MVRGAVVPFYRRLVAAVACCGVMAVLGGAHRSLVWAGTIDFNGAWRYQRQMDPQEGSWSMQQVYSGSLGHELSGNTDLNGSVRYSDLLSSGGDRVRVLRPALQLGLVTTWFNLSTGVAETKRDSERDGELRTRTWNATMTSAMAGYPQVSLRASGSSSADQGANRSTDQQSRSLGAGLEQTLPMGSFSYDFQWDGSRNHVSDTESEDRRHVGRLQFGHAAFRNRVRLSVSQVASYAEHRLTLGTTPGAAYWIPLVVLTGYAGEDSSPENDTLSPLPALTDGDTETGSGFVMAAEAHPNLALATEYQEVDRLVLTVIGEMTATELTDWQWELYASDDGQFWERLGQLGDPEPDYFMNRTELAFSLSGIGRRARYLKLAVTPPSSLRTPVEVTELAAAAERVADGLRETEIQSQFHEETQANLQFQPWQSVSVGYSFRRSRSLASSNPENRSVGHAVHGNWRPLERLYLSGSMNQNQERIEGHEQQTTRALSLGVQGRPIDTLDLSGGYNASESLLGGDRSGRSEGVNVHLGAQLYSDLSASADGRWKKSESRGQEGATESFGWSLGSMARLTPSLQSDLHYETGWGNRTERTQTLAAGMSYRPSSYLSLHLSAQRDFSEERIPATAQLSCKLTEQVQLGAGTGVVIGEAAARQYDGSLDWRLGRAVSLRGAGNLEEGEGPTRWATFVSIIYNP